MQKRGPLTALLVTMCSSLPSCEKLDACIAVTCDCLLCSAQLAENSCQLPAASMVDFWKVEGRVDLFRNGEHNWYFWLGCRSVGNSQPFRENGGATVQRSGSLSSATASPLPLLVQIVLFLSCFRKPKFLAGSYQIGSLLTMPVQSLCRVCVFPMKWLRVSINSLQCLARTVYKCRFISIFRMKLRSECVCHGSQLLSVTI